MKKYIFTDILTLETFEITCFPYQIHSIELINSEFDRWAIGRILKRDEF